MKSRLDSRLRFINSSLRAAPSEYASCCFFPIDFLCCCRFGPSQSGNFSQGPMEKNSGTSGSFLFLEPQASKPRLGSLIGTLRLLSRVHAASLLFFHPRFIYLLFLMLLSFSPLGFLSTPAPVLCLQNVVCLLLCSHLFAFITTCPSFIPCPSSVLLFAAITPSPFHSL